MFARLISAAIVISSLLVFPSCTLAAPVETPAPEASADHPRDGGIIAGKITSVDYQRGIIAIHKTEITVMPSTQIQGSDSGYHAITDLKPGMAVRVYTSQVAGKYYAQIITLR